MTIQLNPHDESIDKLLASLGSAAPPEGMAGRIEQRIHRQAAASAPSPTRSPDALGTPTPAAAWWRGALTGAAAATLAFGLSLAGHRLLLSHADGAHTPIGVPPATAHVTPVSSAALAQPDPCAHPAVLHLRPAKPRPSAAPNIPHAGAYAESVAASHPAPPMPLTADERGLVQFARTAGPSQLASLNTEAQAKLQEEDATEFARFFNPPPEPSNPRNNE